MAWLVVSGRPQPHGSLMHCFRTVATAVDLNGLQCAALSVQVRVAAEFITAAPQQQHPPLTGCWSQKAYSLRVTPGVNLLLHCQPTHTWGKKFTASCSTACSSYEALFPGLSQAKVTSALGEQRCQPGFKRF
jgi:hypothetical protein